MHVTVSDLSLRVVKRRILSHLCAVVRMPLSKLLVDSVGSRYVSFDNAVIFQMLSLHEVGLKSWVGRWASGQPPRYR